MKKTYEERKAEAEFQAIQWQLEFSKKTYYTSELVEFADYFSKLAKRYGLIKEFRENGII